MNAMLPELPRPVTDFPEYWLGQITAIMDMEGHGDLTKHQTVGEIRQILKSMRHHDQQKISRAKQMSARAATTKVDNASLGDV